MLDDPTLGADPHDPRPHTHPHVKRTKIANNIRMNHGDDISWDDAFRDDGSDGCTTNNNNNSNNNRTSFKKLVKRRKKKQKQSADDAASSRHACNIVVIDDDDDGGGDDNNNNNNMKTKPPTRAAPLPVPPPPRQQPPVVIDLTTPTVKPTKNSRVTAPVSGKQQPSKPKFRPVQKKATTSKKVSTTNSSSSAKQVKTGNKATIVGGSKESRKPPSSSMLSSSSSSSSYSATNTTSRNSALHPSNGASENLQSIMGRTKTVMMEKTKAKSSQKATRTLPQKGGCPLPSTSSSAPQPPGLPGMQPRLQQQHQPPLVPPQSDDGMHLREQHHQHRPRPPRKLCRYGIHCTFQSCRFFHPEERIMDRPQQTQYNNTPASQARGENKHGPTSSRPPPPPPPLLSRPSGYDRPHQRGGPPAARNHDRNREPPWKRTRHQPPQRMGPGELYPPRHPDWSSQLQLAHRPISRHAPPPPPPRRDPRNGPSSSGFRISFPRHENFFEKHGDLHDTTAADPLQPPPPLDGMSKQRDTAVGTAAGPSVERFHGAIRSLADTDGYNDLGKGNSTQPFVDGNGMGNSSPLEWRKQRWNGVPHMVLNKHIHDQSRNDLNAERLNRKPPPVEPEIQQCRESEKQSHRRPIEKTTKPGDSIVRCNEVFQHPKASRIPSRKEQLEKKSNNEPALKTMQESDFVPVPDANTPTQPENGSAIFDRSSERSSLSVHPFENHNVTNRVLLDDEKDVIKKESNALIPGNSDGNSEIHQDDGLETEDDELRSTIDDKKHRLVGERNSGATARTPKSSLHALYEQRPRLTQITTKHFLTFDNRKSGKERRFSSIFVCPLTHEAFLARPTFWHHRKCTAEQAAAAQAWNCIAMREGMGSDILFGRAKPYWPFQRPVWPFSKIPSHIIDQLPADFQSSVSLERDKQTVSESDKQPENSKKTSDAKIEPKALTRDLDWDRELKKWRNQKSKAKAKQLENDRYRLMNEAEVLFEDLIKDGTCTEKQVALVVVPYARKLVTSRLKSQDIERPTTLLQDIQTFVSSILKKVELPAPSSGDGSESKERQADGSGPCLGDDVHGTTDHEARESIRALESTPDSFNDSPCHASTNGDGNKKRNRQCFPTEVVYSTPMDDDASRTTNDVNDSISRPVVITTSDSICDTMMASDTHETAQTMPEHPSSTTTDLGEVTPSVESAPTIQQPRFLSDSDNIFDVIVEAARKDPSICNLSVSELLVDPKFHEKLREEYPEIYDYQNERGSHLRTRFAETWIQLKMNRFGISACDGVIKGILDAANEDSTIYELSAGEVIDRFSTELKEQYTGIDNNSWWIHSQFESLWNKMKSANHAKFADVSTRAKTTNTKPVKPIFKPRKRKKVEDATDGGETVRRNAAISNVRSEKRTKSEGIHAKVSVNSSASVSQKAKAPPSSSVPEQRYVFRPSATKESSSQNVFQTKKNSSWFDAFKSKEEAEQEQERLFAAAAARVRSQAKARVASALPQARSSAHPNNRTFSTLVPDIHVAFPDHWQYTNSYARLGLPLSATDIQIKAQYRRLARVYHPDKGGASSKRKFQSVTEAYNTLMNR